VLQGELLDTPGLVRDNVQWNAISMSLGELSPQAVGEASRDLITKAIGAREDQRALALYAGLLVAISRGSTRRAAELVTEVVHAQSIKEPEVRDLRIEIGGRTALKPVLEMLESDFSKPMRRLRHTTMKDWEDASNAAKRAFLIRTLMSVAVFVLGLFVVALSSYQYLFAGNESWGPGISLAAGLAAVLSVVYSGPLSDVRKSVESLTTTSIGFITFMHRLQFVSGLVASDYAHGKLDYPGLDHAERLLQRAAAQATHQIAPSKNSNSRKPRAAREPSASPQTRTQESAASQVELADSLTIDGELGDDTHRGNPDR